MQNKKTTIGGLLSAIALIIGQVAKLFDGDATTNPEWTIVAGAVAIAWAFFKSKDADTPEGPAPTS